jgi:hypothetical protein
LAGAENAKLWGAVRLHVWLALAAGAPFTLDDGQLGRLDQGNVLDGDGQAGPMGRLWVDVSCDVLDVVTHRGAGRADGVMARAEASTATITLADPQRRYDPIEPEASRLRPGMEVLVWAQHSFEVAPDFVPLNACLFLGRAESIIEPWSPHPSQRRCTIIASDVVTDLANASRAELVTPVGHGEGARDRAARILDAFDGPPLSDLTVRRRVFVNAQPTTSHLQGATFAGSAWEQLNAVADAEAGFVFIEPLPAGPYPSETSTNWEQQVQLLPRSTWTNTTADPFTVPCAATIGVRLTATDTQHRTRVTGQRAALPVETHLGPLGAAYDELRQSTLRGIVLSGDLSFAGQSVNYSAHRAGFAAAFYAGGGVWSATDTAANKAALLRWLDAVPPPAREAVTRAVPSPRPLGYTRTDLQLVEAEVPVWAEFLLATFQAPRATIESMTLRPGASPGLWRDVLTLTLAVDRVRLEWQPPDGGDEVAVTGRVIGVDHTITRASWTVDWVLADARLVVSGHLLAEDLTELLTESGDFIRLS